MSTYASPESLVETSWLAEHLNDPSIRIVESNEDIFRYGTGHIANAVHIDWRADLNDPVQRDYIAPDAFAKLAARNGISPDTTVIFYGDKANWWAAYALWVFRLFGHDKVKLLNGGRSKWEAESRLYTREVPRFPTANYPPAAMQRSVLQGGSAPTERRAQTADRCPLAGRFGRDHAHARPQEGVLRGGHIPGARSIPWKTAANDDGTFKSGGIHKIYIENLGVNPGDEMIVYCRIGERSSHTWFVLTYLLGFPRVKNYDGSWTEWGNSVRFPIEKG